jgi:Restriction endonuclease FokI, C terminal
MIDSTTQKQLLQIWDSYKADGKLVFDTKGKAYDNIDGSRLVAIADIKAMIHSFLDGKLELPEFKTNLDSYNKQHNYWGFTAAKGQMFFNLLTRSSEGNMANYIALLKDVLREPTSLDDALAKMKKVFDYATVFQQQASDKRFAANPLSSAYFLSYFWQIHNADKWPVMYSSIIVSFEKLGIWEQQKTSYDNYNRFYLLNEEVRQIISAHAKQSISNWDIEHALWHFAGTVSVNSKQAKPKKSRDEKPLVTVSDETVVVEAPVLEAGFDLSDYLIPRIANLVELGAATEKSTSSRARDFEVMVGETFRLLDFDVELLGQGTGREPDAIIKYPGEHIAFLIDAKAYSNGYTLGTDDRAIREYINYHCPRLKQSGFNKLGFIIVSNSFKSNLKELINDITWSTDIKRFLLVTTEALLHLVAYKTKDKIPVTQIVEKLITFDTVVTKEMIIEAFGDY